MNIQYNFLLTITAAIMLCASVSFYSAKAAAQTTPPSTSSAEGEPVSEPKAAADAGNDLERAYKKEFAFLEAQRRQLEQRLGKFEATAEKDTAKLQQEINRLEDKVISLGSEADRLQEQLQDARRAAELNTDNNDILEATFDQAGASLKRHGFQLIETGEFKALNSEAKIGKLFETAANTVTRLSSIRETQGAFYRRDGTKTQGTVIKIGNIAAYGVGGNASGALAPAGGGELKLWPRSAADTARALYNEQSPKSLEIFLYESLDRQVTADQEETLMDMIDSGGVIAWIIICLGVLALLLIALRTVFLKTASTSTDAILSRVSTLIKRGDMDEALGECQRKKGSMGRVVAAAIRNLDRDREHLEDIISESILNESSHLNRFGGFILVLAAVAPLLGLLGTVTGMISTFDVITEFGTGDPKLLSGGISTALVTTELGLAVAIPTLLLGHLLSGWSERIKDDMEKAALRVTNIYKDSVMDAGHLQGAQQ